MSLRLVEGGIAAGFGALDQVVTAKAGTSGFGGAATQKWSLYLEVAGAAVGMLGPRIGLSAEPLAYSALALLGARSARYAMAGNLFRPGAWAAMGGQESAGAPEGANSGGEAPASIFRPPLEPPGVAG